MDLTTAQASERERELGGYVKIRVPAALSWRRFRNFSLSLSPIPFFSHAHPINTSLSQSSSLSISHILVHPYLQMKEDVFVSHEREKSRGLENADKEGGGEGWGGKKEL